MNKKEIDLIQKINNFIKRANVGIFANIQKQKVILNICVVGENVNNSEKNDNFITQKTLFTMRDWLRALIAGYGAHKLGGGCLSTVVIFCVIYWLLGPHGCH